MKKNVLLLILVFALSATTFCGCESELASGPANDPLLTATGETAEEKNEKKTETVEETLTQEKTEESKATQEENKTENTETPEPPAADVLSGKRALFVGDSICKGYADSKKKAWAGRIADATGLIAVNNGVSGTSVSDVRKAKQGIIVNQLQFVGDFDYVVLHGGVNDAWSKAKVGTMSDSFSPDSFDTSTFAGGLENLIYTAIKNYGDKACIGYLINFKAPNCEKGYVAEMDEYVEMTKKICDKWQISYFDMYNHQEITAKLKFNTQLYTTDYIHPTAGGYDVLAPYIAQYMRTMTPCTQEILNQVG